jgi:hypothetical protein
MTKRYQMVIRRFKSPFGIFWPLYRVSYFDLCLLIIPLVSFGHCIICPSSIDAFWLSLNGQKIPKGQSEGINQSRTDDTMAKRYQRGNQKAYIECLLITTLVYVGHCIVCPTLIDAFWLPLWYLLASVSSVLLWFMPSEYPFVIFWPVYCLSYFDLWR